MSKQHYFIIFSLFCIFRIHISTQISHSFPSDLKLVKTIVVFRHGMRAPAKSYKFDPYTETDRNDVWPEGFGSLINEGKSQMYFLGKCLRERYEHLLLPYGNTVAEDVQMVTTAVDRCYQSAALVLAGFYPPDSQHVWNDDLLWQPVPIHSTSPDKTHILGKKEACPSYHEEEDKILNMMLRNVDSDSKANYDYLINYLSNFTYSDNITNADALTNYVYYMQLKKSLNLILPDWATDDFFDKLNKFYVDRFNWATYNSKLREMIAGPLLKDILHQIRDAMLNYSSNPKFYFYSGHDVTLMALLYDFNMKRDFVPTFGASFIFEVYRSAIDDYSIRVLFNRDYSLQQLDVKVLQNCEEYCSAVKFFQIFEKYLILDWKKICNL